MRGFMVRDVVDMDVALHGRRFIVGEFVLMSLFGLGFAGMQVYVGAMRGPIHALQLTTGFYVAFVTLNCLTFLVLALGAKKPTVPAMRSVLWLSAAALVLLAVPVAFPLLAAREAAMSRSMLVKGEV